jgi:hypothetical protein
MLINPLMKQKIIFSSQIIDTILLTKKINGGLNEKTIFIHRYPGF